MQFIFHPWIPWPCPLVNNPTLVGREAPEESVSLVSPDQTVVLVVLYRGLCKLYRKVNIALHGGLQPCQLPDLLPITAGGFL